MKKKISTAAISVLLITFLLFFNSFTIDNSKYYSEDWAFEEARRFDFWIGEWRVNNRFKQDDNSWKDEGKGHLKVWPVLDGKAIMEFWDGTGRNNNTVKGFSLRYFDKAKDKWITCLNWPQKNNGGFFFLTGNFRFNRCEIFNQYTNQRGEFVTNRFTFSDITDTSYRWNDDSSLDTGKTWSSNWIMENFRLQDIPQWPKAGEKFHTYSNDSYSITKESKRFHFLEGTWKGKLSDSTASGWDDKNIEVNFWKVHNGISIFYELNSETIFKELGMMTYRAQNDIWLSMRLDNKKNTEIITKLWKPADNEIKFNEYSQLYSKNSTEIEEYNFSESKKIEITRFNVIDSSKSQISKQLIKLEKIN